MECARTVVDMDECSADGCLYPERGEDVIQALLPG